MEKGAGRAIGGEDQDPTGPGDWVGDFTKPNGEQFIHSLAETHTQKQESERQPRPLPP